MCILCSIFPMRHFLTEKTAGYSSLLEPCIKPTYVKAQEADYMESSGRLQSRQSLQRSSLSYQLKLYQICQGVIKRNWAAARKLHPSRAKLFFGQTESPLGYSHYRL